MDPPQKLYQLGAKVHFPRSLMFMALEISALNRTARAGAPGALRLVGPLRLDDTPQQAARKANVRLIHLCRHIYLHTYICTSYKHITACMWTDLHRYYACCVCRWGWVYTHICICTYDSLCVRILSPGMQQLLCIHHALAAEPRGKKRLCKQNNYRHEFTQLFEFRQHVSKHRDVLAYIHPGQMQRSKVQESRWRARSLVICGFQHTFRQAARSSTTCRQRPALSAY